MANEKKNKDEQIMEAARRDAEAFAQGKTKEQLNAELKRMNRGPGLLGWIRDRVNVVLNFAKVTAMAIVLGRRETSRRMDIGTAEAEREKHEKSLSDSVKREVLMARIKEMERAEEPDKEEEKESDPGKNHDSEQEAEQDQEQQQEQEPQLQPEQQEAENEQTQDEHGTDSNSTQQQQEQPEAPSAQEQSEKPLRETILAQQCREMTETYKEGLSRYIENITGIDRQYFTVGNVDGRIRIDFGSLNDVSKAKDNPFRNGVTLDDHGCVQEHKNPVSKAIGTAVLYYTAEVYRDSKNQTQFPGTRPSDRMVSETIDRLTAKLEANERAGGPPKNFSAPLFGHVLTVGRDRNSKDKGIFCSIDGEKGRVDDRQALEKWVRSEIVTRVEGQDKVSSHDYTINGQENGIKFSEHTKGIGGDYGRIPEFRKELHGMLYGMAGHGSIPQECVKKYTEEELCTEFNKKLQTMLTDGRTIEGLDGERKPDLSRGFDFGEAHFHVELKENKLDDEKTELAVESVVMINPDRASLDKESVSLSYVYGEFDGVDAQHGYNENTENIARYMSDGYIAQYGEYDKGLEDLSQEKQEDELDMNPFVDDTRQDLSDVEMMHEIDEFDFEM